MNSQGGDHDLLIELKTKLDAVIESIRELKDGTAAKIEDHEKRIRFLERYVWAVIGVLTVAQFVTQLVFK